MNIGKKRKTKPIRLLPVMRPIFNAREIIKQLILVEDHLFQAQKRCSDCIKKHLCAVEALAEEAVTLACPKNPKKACPRELLSLASDIRVIQHAWAQNPKNETVVTVCAKKLRQIRKRLMRQLAVLPLTSLPDREQAKVKAILAEGAKGAKGSKKQKKVRAAVRSQARFKQF